MSALQKPTIAAAQLSQHKYSYQCIMVEAVGYGPGPRPSWNSLSAVPLSWTHKTTIPKGCLSSLWYRIQFPLFSSLYSLTHTSLQPGRVFLGTTFDLVSAQSTNCACACGVEVHRLVYLIPSLKIGNGSRAEDKRLEQHLPEYVTVRQFS